MTELSSGETPWHRGLLRAAGGALLARLCMLLLLVWWVDFSAAPGPQPPVEQTPAPPPGHRFYHDVGRVPGYLGYLCATWDSYLYLNIAKYGYEVVEGEMSNTAFLPAYPYLIRMVSAFGVDAPAAGVAISVLCFLACLPLAYAYARQWHGEHAAAAALLWFVVFPSSWVLNMIFSEGLFCLGLFGFLVMYHRGRYIPAGLFGIVAVMTRTIGLALIPAIILDIGWTAYRERRFAGQRLFALAGVVVGFGITCAILQAAVGDGLAFLRQSAGWTTQREFAGAWFPLLESLNREFRKPEVYGQFPLLVIYFMAGAWLLLRRRDISSFFVAVYLLLLLRVSHSSQMRYLLPLLPIHVLLADELTQRKWFAPVVACLAAAHLLLTRCYLGWSPFII
jgi:hypothetical protein